MLNIDQIIRMFQHWSSFGWVQHTSLLMFHLSSFRTIYSTKNPLSVPLMKKRPWVVSADNQTLKLCSQQQQKNLLTYLCVKGFSDIFSSLWIVLHLGCPPKQGSNFLSFPTGLPQLNSDFFGGGVISRRLYNRRLTADWQKWSLVWLKTALTGVCSIY